MSLSHCLNLIHLDFYQNSPFISAGNPSQTVLWMPSLLLHSCQAKEMKSTIWFWEHLLNSFHLSFCHKWIHSPKISTGPFHWYFWVQSEPLIFIKIIILKIYRYFSNNFLKYFQEKQFAEISGVGRGGVGEGSCQ